ncbi:MAG: hypothetical protein A2033_15750 [Bacteroidetes bacterium GWA2_31_9]|nr:MAG: hypothetical protein A2033_15750 [Bacteroidetes bacterium GWA2_31_9]
MKVLIFSLFIAICFKFSYSQVLPNYLTEEEKLKLPLKFTNVNKSFTTPPSGSVRNPAEWEEMQAILIAWEGYSDFLTEIVRYAVDECQVYIYCTNQTTVSNYLTSSGVDVTNVHYIIQNLNSVWIRDYGPNNIYSNDVGDLSFVDWIYNRPRPQDDASPAAIASLLSIPLYETTQAPTDLVNTGGNFMSDGFGTAFAEKLILTENDASNPYGVTTKSEAEIDDIFNQWMGINRYIKIDELPYDGIHHIDMHMKLLDEETLLIGEFPQGISDGPQIEANINYIQSNFLSVFGTPYKIVRIPMPPSSSGAYPDESYYRTYTNSLIINKTVLVPTYYEEYDTTALRIYREAMSGYRVIGIDANAIIPASGTIHCTTHEIGVINPLLISHQNLPDTYETVNPYYAEAKIMHSSGINTAKLYYRTDTTQAYQTVDMTEVNALENLWGGFIPAKPANTTIYYYIEANANSGKSQIRPMTAPTGYFKFHILNSTNSNLLTRNEFNFNVNSSNENIEINIISETQQTFEIQIIDILGNTIYKKNYQVNAGRNTFISNANNISYGIYIVTAKNEKSSSSKKIVIN